MKGNILRIPSFVLFLFVLSSYSWSQQLGNVYVGQTDFYDVNGQLALENSSYGYIEFDIEPHPTDVLFVNFVAEDTSGNPQWIVQNMPILPTSMAVTINRHGVDFNIQDLGFQPLQNMPQIRLGWSITPQLQTNFPPVPPPQPMPVDDMVWNAHGMTGPGNSTVPAINSVPFGCHILLIPTDVVKHDSTAGLQEDNLGCLAGAFARSIDWLNREYSLGSTKTAQQWYKCLQDNGVPATTSTYGVRVAAKDTIFRDLTAKGKMKLLDKCKSLDSVNGIPQDTATDVLKFICDELPGRDVEIHYGGHIVCLTGKFKVQGNTYLCFRDDEHQGDSSKGDKAEKIACIIKDTAGNYQFRRNDSFGSGKVKVVISEYVDTTANYIAGGAWAGTQVRMYPNPGPGLFSLEIDAPQPFKGFIEVLNLSGQRIFREGIQIPAGESDHSLDLRDYPDGAYILKMYDPGGKESLAMRLIKLN